MSEEQVTQSEEKPAEAAEAKQEAPKESAKTETAPSKKKKINKLSLEDINKKIDELNSSNQTQSRFYRELIKRKNEISPVS